MWRGDRLSHTGAEGGVPGPRSEVWGVGCVAWSHPASSTVHPVNSPVFLMREITHRQLVACISHTATNSGCQDQQSQGEVSQRWGVAVCNLEAGGGERAGSQAGGTGRFVPLPTWDFPH